MVVPSLRLWMLRVWPCAMRCWLMAAVLLMLALQLLLRLCRWAGLGRVRCLLRARLLLPSWHVVVAVLLKRALLRLRLC